MPSDIMIRTAQGLLDRVRDLEQVRNELLTMPAWIPIGEHVAFLGGKIRIVRNNAARVLRCDPILLED